MTKSTYIQMYADYPMGIRLIIIINSCENERVLLIKCAKLCKHFKMPTLCEFGIRNISDQVNFTFRFQRKKNFFIIYSSCEIVYLIRNYYNIFLYYSFICSVCVFAI